jgi:hypothetical protein
MEMNQSLFVFDSLFSRPDRWIDSLVDIVELPIVFATRSMDGFSRRHCRTADEEDVCKVVLLILLS